MSQPVQTQERTLPKIMNVKECVEKCISDIGDGIMSAIVRFVHDKSLQQALITQVLPDVEKKCIDLCV